MPLCNQCHEPFDNYIDLAKHILTNKKTHRKSVKWAMSFKLKHAMFEPAGKVEGKIPLTAEQRESKADSQRILSGEAQYCTILCPSCNLSYPERLPIEYTKSNTAWKSNGMFLVNCQHCRK